MIFEPGTASVALYDRTRRGGERVRGDGSEVFDGTYEAARAAALAGVPLSTVYDWARKEVIVPSVSQSRVKLWSYADLMALRITSWLRQPKRDGEVPASSMTAVRMAMKLLRESGDSLWSTNEAGDHRSPLLVSRSGEIHVRSGAEVSTLAGQLAMGEILNPLGPFDAEGHRGPDLVRPRPHLRIVPGKVAGEPHLAGSRITSLSVAALSLRGFDLERIAVMYPDEDPAAILDAIDLEHDLAPAAA